MCRESTKVLTEQEPKPQMFYKCQLPFVKELLPLTHLRATHTHSREKRTTATRGGGVTWGEVLWWELAAALVLQPRLHAARPGAAPAPLRAFPQGVPALVLD